RAPQDATDFGGRTLAIGAPGTMPAATETFGAA
ncbi:MAG: hypothetical protein JWQ55_5295, partial [Rhodopila sp.]|nr:hypothetical protein [Rhodopila sp.]